MNFGFLLVSIFCIFKSIDAQSPKPSIPMPPKPECLQEHEDFHQCLQEQHKASKSKPSEPDFKAIAKEHDDCFTSAGCRLPRLTERKPESSKPNAPPPGAIGSPPGAPDEDLLQCFKNVGPKIQNIFFKCMQSKDPDFGAGMGPGGIVPGHPPPGFMARGGPPPSGPPPHGGPIGGPPMGGDFGSPPLDFLTKSCNGSESKAKKVDSCLADVREKHKPSKSDVKKHYDEMCRAQNACKSKLGDCDAKMKKKQQYVCECTQNFTAASQEIFKQEPTCSKVNLNQPKSPKPEIDCKKPPANPCDDGFDKFYEKVTSKHFQPPPPHAPPQ